VAEENKKILKRRKKKILKKHMWRGIPSPHLINGILWREWVVISFNQV
jgi:hypothetical protein